MAKSCNSLGIPAGHMTQAVSDGELNMSARGCGGSSSSLPGTPGGEASQANSVLSWAVSFEKLLEDPAGVQYFTDFLKSEVSAENILFWQACEKFQKIPAANAKELQATARFIYNTYLSDSAPYSVNIDDTAKMEESDLQQPAPHMFSKAQAQIYKLMKMDSYRRFVRSPLYQSCTLASVEGKHLPRFSSELPRMGSAEEVARRSPSKKPNIKSDSNSPARKPPADKLRHKRGSWGATEASQRQAALARKESSISVKSTSSVELGSPQRQMENGRSSPRSPDQAGEAGSRPGLEGGYCCVYLPDGSASLAPTRPGLPIRDMLSGLCEKRGFPLKDVIIYLQGKDRQPLSMDQDCSVLRDQQVSLELRVTFALEVAFSGKTVGIVAKSSKTLQDALSMALQKHQLKPQEALVSVVGSDEVVTMSTTVFRLANKTLRLDRAKGREQGLSRTNSAAASTQSKASSPEGAEPRPLPPHADGAKTQPKPSKNRDMDGLLDMLSRAQCYRVDDQRGLLTKEQLEVPLFLQLPSDQAQEQNPCRQEPSDPQREPSKSAFTSGSQSATRGEEKPAESAAPEHKDFKETTI